MSEFMLKAVQEALAGVKSGKGGPFGAVIVNKDGTIVAAGSNRVIESNDPTAHAEITTIREGACLWSRLDKVYYENSRQEAANAGFDDAAFYEIVKSEQKLSETCEYMAAEGDEERKIALEPFKLWIDKNDKVPY